MGIIQLILLAVGLSMDAFSAAVCRGLGTKKLSMKNALVTGLYFGGFQALMPVIGWFLGKRFESYIVSIDHWIAFVLLSFIGGKMLFDAIKGSDETKDEVYEGLNHKELLILAVATSIDALAVGVTLAFLNVDILASAISIGVITFAFSFLGVIIGNKFGNKYEKKAQIFGGAILILIGIKILLEHLGVINF